MGAGPPPLIFTPGSGAATLNQFFRESVGACELGGHRAMLVTNFRGQVPRSLPDNVKVFSYLPFSKILPRCSCLVYPGGIGTMAQGINAGVPPLIVPHAHDQPDNAFRIKRLGLGEFIYPEFYKARQVTRLLRRVMGSPATRRYGATHVGSLNSEAAVERACNLVEGLQVRDPCIHFRTTGQRSQGCRIHERNKG